VVSLHGAAVTYSAQLPAADRGTFVDGISTAAAGGVRIGAAALSSGISTGAAALVRQVAHQVYVHAYVDAMRPSLLLPIAVLLIAAAGSLTIRVRQPAGERAGAARPGVTA